MNLHVFLVLIMLLYALKKCFCFVKMLAFFLSMVIKKFVSKLVWSEGHTCL